MAQHAVDKTFEDSLLEVTRQSLLFQSALKWKWKQSRQAGRTVWLIALRDTNFLNWSHLQKGLESLPDQAYQNTMKAPCLPQILPLQTPEQWQEHATNALNLSSDP